MLRGWPPAMRGPCQRHALVAGSRETDKGLDGSAPPGADRGLSGGNTRIDTVAPRAPRGRARWRSSAYNNSNSPGEGDRLTQEPINTRSGSAWWTRKWPDD